MKDDTSPKQEQHHQLGEDLARVRESYRTTLEMMERVRAEHLQKLEAAQRTLERVQVEREQIKADQASRDAASQEVARRRKQEAADRTRREETAKVIVKSRAPITAAKRMHKGMEVVALPPSTTKARVKELVELCRTELQDGTWDWIEARHRPRYGYADKTLIAFFFSDPSRATFFKLVHGGSV